MLKTTMTFVIHHSKPIPEMADLFANRISTHSSVEHVEVQEAPKTNLYLKFVAGIGWVEICEDEYKRLPNDWKRVVRVDGVAV